MKKFKWTLIVVGFMACVTPRPPCPGDESVHGTCYLNRPSDWSMVEIEEREAWWLSRVADDGYDGTDILQNMNVHVVDDFPTCGGTRPIYGCLLGPTMAMLGGLPLCRSALAHEMQHALFARDHKDADLDHVRPVWKDIDAKEYGCPPLHGEWLVKACHMYRAWNSYSSTCKDVP